MKKKHLLFFITEICCTVALALLAALSLKKGYTALFLTSVVGICISSLLIGLYKGSLPKTKKDKKTLKKQKTKKQSGFWLTVSIVLLINQSIGIVDLLPDFIAYLIIARTLNYAAYKAPGFSEARSAFLKLALVNFLKFPALILLAGSRTVNTMGNDLTSVMSLSFAVMEFIFLISAVKNLFEALFRLGERTEATSLIRPIRLFGFIIPVDFIKGFTLVYAVTRCIFEFLPDLFLLTGTAGDGFTIVTIRIGYPIFIVITQLVGNLMGILWLVMITKYLRAVHKEGKFLLSLDAIEQGFSPIGFKTRKFVAKLKLGLSFMLIASLLSFELKFDNTLEINILPHAIQAILFIISIYFIKDAIDKRKKRNLFTLSVVYLVSSLISYVAEIYFMYEFGYRALLKDAGNATAEIAYTFYEIVTAIECIALIVFLTFLANSIKQIILNHTAIPPTHERYSRADADYHKAFIKRNRLLCAFGIIMALSRTVNVFTQGRIETFFTTQPVITLMPSIPWFGLFVFITAAAYGGLSLYFTSILKEEVEMKYIEQ